MFINEWRKTFYQYHIFWICVFALAIASNIFYANDMDIELQDFNTVQQLIVGFESILLDSARSYFFSILLPCTVTIYLLLNAVGNMEQLRYQGRIFLIVFRLITLGVFSAVLALISQFIYLMMLGLMPYFLTDVSLLYVFMIWHGTFTVGLIIYFVYELLDRRHLLPIVLVVIGAFFLLMMNFYTYKIREHLFYLVYSEKALAFSSTFVKELVAKGGLNVVCIVGILVMSGTGSDIIQLVIGRIRRFSYRQFMTPVVYKLALALIAPVLFVRYRNPDLDLLMLFYPDLSHRMIGVWQVVMDNMLVVWLYALCILFAHDYFLRQLLEPDIFETVRIGNRQSFVHRFIVQTLVYSTVYALIVLPVFVCLNGSIHSGQWQVVFSALPFFVICLWSLLLMGGAIGLIHPALGICAPVILVILSLFAKAGYAVIVLRPEWHMQGLLFHLFYGALAVVLLKVFYVQKDMR